MVRDLVDEVLGRCDSTPVEGGDPARERVDEAVQLRVRKCSVDVSVSFRSVAVESFAPRTISSARPRPTRCGRRSVPRAGMHSHPRLRVGPVACSRATRSAYRRRGRTRCSTPRTQPRIFAMLATGDLVRRTNVSIRIGRPEGPTAVVMFPVLPVKSKWAR